MHEALGSTLQHRTELGTVGLESWLSSWGSILLLQGTGLQEPATPGPREWKSPLLCLRPCGVHQLVQAKGAQKKTQSGLVWGSMLQSQPSGAG